MEESSVIYEREFHRTEDSIWKITISTFRGVEYLNIRRYFMSYEEEWIPTKDGINVELTFTNVKELFISFLEILSLAESKDLIEEHFKEVLDAIYK